MSMLSLILSLLLSVLPYAATVSTTDGYELLRKQAEASYAEKSFGIAHDFYEQAAKLDLPPKEKRWVAFRLADTAWRSDAASPSPDPTSREKSREALQKFLDESKDDHDRLWAEAQESLGDAESGNQYGYGGGDDNYLAALDWWAGSADLELARRRYLDLVWKLIRSRSRYSGQEENATGVPRQVLVNAVAIAQTVQDRDRARYHLAVQYLAESTAQSIERAYELLDLVIADGRQSEWYDDALFVYGTSLERAGNVVVTEGNATLRQNYVRALEFFRRIVKEFQKSETRYYDQAQAQIRDITFPRVQVEIGQTFLPESEQEVILNWRNVRQIELTIAAVDLSKVEVRANSNWMESLPVEPSRVVRRWTVDTKDTGEHVPGLQRERVSPRLPLGAYVVAASGSGASSSRRLLLVSDANVLLQSINGHVQAYVCNALTGEPLAGAEGRAFNQYESEVQSQSVRTGADGLADFRFPNASYSAVTVFASAPNGRQAYATAQTWRQRGDEPLWRIYAFTDRPAYRPEETVQWKFIARTGDGEQWKTPAGGTLQYEIVNPRGETVASADAKLNAFGSAWGELPLTAAMPLGEYSIRFRSNSKSQYVGYASLFRLEEYKLPEYRVSVSTAEENGKRSLYRLGDTIEATVEASYYFGGPVANATVDVRVTSSPYVRYWHPWREYPWYYDDEPNASSYGYPGGEEVLHQTLKTDENGRVVVRIETPRDGRDRSYHISATVTDASRRQVSGTGTVRVMNQRYAVYLRPQHAIHRPKEKVSLDFEALDANDQPVVTTGTVTVVRNAWRNDAGPRKNGAWQEEPVLTTKVTTDAEGKATFTFTPPRNGYYLVRWTSEDGSGKGATLARDIVSAQTMLWVTERNVDDFDYHSTGFDVVVDRDTLHAGDRAAVLLLAPESGRWVVVTTVANDILETQVVHLDGTVKLLELPIDERHAPNFFITASSVSDRTLVTQTRRVVVPPVEKFVKVEVKPDREQYEPKQKGSVTVTTRDAQGRPVAAEVALSVSDESVTAIGEDPAGDPRQFFFSDVRQQQLRITASVQEQQYVRRVADEN
ncbi:MAG TPA: MG2 domain-containing protein, partial [Thermoanaerobaculia bacterium]|nr:MG2 domain-containing protein [Thermoanaerobaculia bacterium]